MTRRGPLPRTTVTSLVLAAVVALSGTGRDLLAQAAAKSAAAAEVEPA